MQKTWLPDPTKGQQTGAVPPLHAYRLLITVAIALLLVLALAALVGSSMAAAALDEPPAWHDFSPQGWVNTFGVVSSVDLTSTVAPVQASARYSVSLNSGTDWVGPYNATLTNLSAHEWRLATALIAVLPGQANRVRYAVDITGGQRLKSDAYTIKMDRDVPELDIVAPQAGAYVSNANLTIAGTASDSLSGLEGISLTVGTQVLTPVLAPPNWSASWPTPGEDGMQYTLDATAQDRAGNLITETVAFTVDRVLPVNPTSVVEVHGIQNGAALPSPTSLRFEWSGASDGGGIAGYQVYWGTAVNGTSTTLASTAAFTPTAMTQVGRYYLRMSTKDRAGNMAPWWTAFEVTLQSTQRRLFLPFVQVPPPWRRFEPNDSLATAYGPLVSGQRYEAFIWPSGDQDYYFVNVTSTSVDLTIRLANIPTGVDYDLYLYNSVTATAPVASSAQYSNVDEFIRYRPSTAGRYFIRIYPYQGANKDQPYHLTATFR